MNPTNPISRWPLLAPYFHALLRMVAALTLMLAGTMKIFAFPNGMPPNGGTAPFMSQIWIGGVLEVFGGALVLIGLFTRPVTFILSGMMAVAYFQFHFPQNPWPTINGGVPAIIYCLVFFYLSAAGAGPWSVDAARRHRRPQVETGHRVSPAT